LQWVVNKCDWLSNLQQVDKLDNHQSNHRPNGDSQ